MEDQMNKELAIFNQICEVNELDPQAIQEKSSGDASAEQLIRTALDDRAKSLIGQLNISDKSKIEGNGEEYKIDADPAAPSFVINEENIRNKYSAEQAVQIIDVLGQVKLPVQP